MQSTASLTMEPEFQELVSSVCRELQYPDSIPWICETLAGGHRDMVSQMQAEEATYHLTGHKPALGPRFPNSSASASNRKAICRHME